MKIQTMRAEVSKVYPNDIWAQKVKKMTDNQILAIWYSFQRNGKFDTSSVVKNNERKEVYEQLTFDDILIGYDESNGEDMSAYVTATRDEDVKC